MFGNAHNNVFLPGAGYMRPRAAVVVAVVVAAVAAALHSLTVMRTTLILREIPYLLPITPAVH